VAKTSLKVKQQRTQKFSTREYSTSGANDTIFIKFLSLSSLATGPNIRVPVGCLSSLITTAAFSSNLI